MHQLSIFIFRRDHRLHDNTALLHALRSSAQVLPCFIFDTAQIDSAKNQYFSNNCVQFMIESLKDLDTDLRQRNSRLFFFHGDIESTVRSIINSVKPDAFYVNEDITPYSIERDKKISEICKDHNVAFYSYEDILINSKDELKMPNGEPFRVFAYYYLEAKKLKVPEPVKNTYKNFVSGDTKIEGEYPAVEITKFYIENSNIEVRGGRKKALRILQNIKIFKNYFKKRNFPNVPTTKLSAYNKFGCVSIREVYQTVAREFGKNCKLAKELFWRDFYYYIAYHNPHVLAKSMKPEYNGIEWEENKEWLQKWKDGQTGCPIVDAGMRHLNAKGYMPNRLRMVVANYLVKDMLQNWKLGEQYFAQKLVDYDPCQNNGGWQWCASTGTDYRQNIRIFNPMLQSKKFDKDGEYILAWVPELKNVEKDHIHNWETCFTYYKGKGVNYPDPLFLHADRRKKCLEVYQKAKFSTEPKVISPETAKMIEEERKKLKNRPRLNLKRKAEAPTALNQVLKKVKPTETEEVQDINAQSKLKISDWFNLFANPNKN